MSDLSTIVEIISDSKEYLQTYEMVTSTSLWALIGALLLLSVLLMKKEVDRKDKKMSATGWAGLAIFSASSLYAILALVYITLYSLILMGT